jgi:hypothetical protein
MKRRLSLLLAVVMVLGSFSFAFAANDEINYGKFLEENGVLKGDTEGNLNLDKPLERRDSVIMLSRLLKAEDEAKAFKEEGLPTWKDNNDPNYNGYLAWGQSNKYFQGHNDTTFGPRENITVKEYSIVLLRALGYVDEAGVWKEAFETAKKLGVLEGIEKAADEDVLRGEMAQMTFNALGTKMKGSDKTLAEKLEIEMPAPKELKAEVKDTENLKEVVVSLTNAKLANKDKLENASNYRIDGNTIERVEVKGDDVLVQVKDTFRSGKQYELQIKGVDKAIDGKYKFIAKDNTIPAVEKVEALGEYGIKVVTSEPIEDVKGKNFLVDGRYVVMNVEIYGRNLILTPYNGSFPSDAKTLTIEGLKDFAGYKSAKEDFDIEIVKDNEAPKVEDVILKGNKVEVVFDKDIYKSSVEGYDSRSSVGNISYELGRHTIYANEGKKVDTNKAVYEFKDSEAPSRRDSVTIVDVANHSKVKMEKTKMAVREVIDDIEPEIVSKKVVAKNVDKGTMTIELHFDKDVAGSFETKDKDETKFDVDDHFTLYDGEVYKRNIVKPENGKVASAEYAKDEKDDDKYLKNVIVVKLENLKPYNKDKENEYVLEIENFVDASSSRNKMYRDYYEFKFEKGTSFAIKSIDVVTKGKRDTEIEIEFSKALDRDIAEEATNYIFYSEDKDSGKRTSEDDVADLEGEVILKNNGKVVVLEIPVAWEDLIDDYDGLKVLDVIKDTKGNRLNKTYYFDLKLEDFVNVEEVLPVKSAITYINAGKPVEKDELVLDVATDMNTISVKITGKENDTAQVVVYDKNGLVVNTLLDTITIGAGKTEETKAIKTQALAKDDVYTIVTKMGKEEAKLVVKAIDTDLAATIVYNADNTIKNDNVTGDINLVLPYGTDVNALSKDAFTIKGKTTATVKEITKSVNKLFITVAAENGEQDVYTVTLDVQKVTAVTPQSPVAGTTLTVKVEDQQSAAKVIKGIEAAKFSVTMGTNGSEAENKVTKVVDNNDGTYTLTLTDALVQNEKVIVTVDGKPSTATAIN